MVTPLSLSQSSSRKPSISLKISPGLDSSQDIGENWSKVSAALEYESQKQETLVTEPSETGGDLDQVEFKHKREAHYNEFKVLQAMKLRKQQKISSDNSSDDGEPILNDFISTTPTTLTTQSLPSVAASILVPDGALSTVFQLDCLTVNHSESTEALQ